MMQTSVFDLPKYVVPICHRFLPRYTLTFAKNIRKIDELIHVTLLLVVQPPRVNLTSLTVLSPHFYHKKIVIAMNEILNHPYL